MTKEEYSEYLQSDHWQKVRAERLEYDRYKCVCCGAESDLHVHHITYDRLGHESVQDDLVTLCQPCHFKLHEILDRENAFIRQENESYSSEFRNCFQALKSSFMESVRSVQIEHERRLNKKAAYIMYEMLGGRRPGCTATMEKMLKSSLEKFTGITFSLRPAYYAELPRAGTLYRVLRGKRKDGADINTVQDWEAAYDKLQQM